MASDWKEARIDRLTERVDCIERERREERQRALDRWTYLMLALVWIAAIATVVVAAVAGGDAGSG